MRIIAGTARGRRFDAPKGMDTRPTLDRVKESLFGMLQFDIPGSSVLDLFSGSGNLGLEAASRGAASVVCNDRNRDCAAQIEQNAKQLGLNALVRVLNMDYAVCIGRLKGEGATFDFVFLDAPYQGGTAQKAAELAAAEGILQPGARVIIEHAADLPPEVDERLLHLVETRRYGSCAISVFQSAEREATAR